MLWKDPPPTSPLTIFVFPFVFFNISVPPFTSLFAIDSRIISSRSSSPSSSSRSTALVRDPRDEESLRRFLAVSADEMSTSDSSSDSTCKAMSSPDHSSSRLRFCRAMI